MARQVCIVSPGNLASNPRVLKEADALHQAGYDVTAIVCNYTEALRAFDDDIARKVPWSVRRVSRSPWEPYLRRASSLIARASWRAGLGVPSLIAATASGGPVQALRRASLGIPADLYIAHYIAALPAAAAAAERHGGMLGFDAEDLHSGEGTGGPDEDFRMAMVRTVERAYLPSCVHLTASAPQIGEAYSSLYGVSSTTLLNVFPLDMATAGPRQDSACARRNDLRAYWFSQTVGPDRGLQDFMRGMAKAKARVFLDIRGSDRWGHGEALMKLARDLGFAERVRLLPMAAPDKMAKLATPYDLGLSLETDVTESRRCCLPNKTFVYLLAGLPVMMSETPAQSALAPQLGDAAVLVSLGDPQVIAQALDGLAGSPERLSRAKAAAWRLGRQRYNWEVEKRVLLDAVESAFARRGRP
jgi:glycosyltransferase involved in cell wall biosynthesis